MTFIICYLKNKRFQFLSKIESFLSEKLLFGFGCEDMFLLQLSFKAADSE